MLEDVRSTEYGKVDCAGGNLEYARTLTQNESEFTYVRRHRLSVFFKAGVLLPRMQERRFTVCMLDMLLALRLSTYLRTVNRNDHNKTPVCGAMEIKENTKEILILIIRD